MKSTELNNLSLIQSQESLTNEEERLKKLLFHEIIKPLDWPLDGENNQEWSCKDKKNSLTLSTKESHLVYCSNKNIGLCIFKT